jgi:hypothetical protein
MATESEQMFEAYLSAHNLSVWRYEMPQPGVSRKPDYCLSFQDRTSYFELKEFKQKAPHSGWAGTFDPYSAIREKINQAQRQFREYKDRECTCSLVLYKAAALLVQLDDPWTVLAAMLGDFGCVWQYDQTNQFAQAENVFRGRGKMIRYRPDGDTSQNTTIQCADHLVTLQYDSRGTKGGCLTRRKAAWA